MHVLGQEECPLHIHGFSLLLKLFNEILLHAYFVILDGSPVNFFLKKSPVCAFKQTVLIHIFS